MKLKSNSIINELEMIHNKRYNATVQNKLRQYTIKWAPLTGNNIENYNVDNYVHEYLT